MLPHPESVLRDAIPVDLAAGLALSSTPGADRGTRLALALMRHMVQPVILMDPDGRVTQLNPAAQSLLTPGEPGRFGPGGRFWWQLWPHADGLALREALAEAAGGETVRVTLDCRRAVASTAVLVPIEDAGGGVAKVMCLLRAR